MQKKEMEVEGLTISPLEEDQVAEQTPPLFYETPKPNLRPSRSCKRKSSCSAEKIARRIRNKKSHTELKTKHVIQAKGLKYQSCKQNRSAKGIPDEVKSPAMIRAEELQSNLEPNFPSFVKVFSHSHVTVGFWMGLPVPFKKHLPSGDVVLTLEDECGRRYSSKYLYQKNGLSAGWRNFSIEHKLLEGDVAVFQLVEPTKFKVYIIREEGDFTEIDAALSLLILELGTNQMDVGKLNYGLCNFHIMEFIELLNVNIALAILVENNAKVDANMSRQLPDVEKSIGKFSRQGSGFQIDKLANQSENDSEEVGSEVLEGFKLSLPIPFQEITSFEDFSVQIDGFSLDNDLPEDKRNKYYHLCCSQNAYLHENLMKDLNFKLIVGIIFETVNIADALKACTITTSRDEFSTWEKTLKAFELLGLNVGFLLVRISQIVSVAFDSEGGVLIRKYVDAIAERACTEDEIRNLEAKLVELKNERERLEGEVENWKSRSKKYELMFQKTALSPW